MTRRGLTLLEVLLATALLALAATGMASAVDSITRPAFQPEASIHELAASIDNVLRNPVQHNLDITALAAGGQGSINLDGVTVQITVRIRSGRGAWVEFHRDEQRIARWVRVTEARP